LSISDGYQELETARTYFAFNASVDMVPNGRVDRAGRRRPAVSAMTDECAKRGCPMCVTRRFVNSEQRGPPSPQLSGSGKFPDDDDGMMFF
jgi:hypothetical protein